MRCWKGFLINLQFFTIIPVPFGLPVDEHHIKSAVKTFPLLGLLQGVLYASFLYVLMQWTPFSIFAVAFALWLFTIVLTGGIHLDGWMDTSDAYFSYRSIDKRLEIMKDPRTGAFGVLAIIILLSAKFLFLFEISQKLTSISYLLIVLIPFFSKSMMGLLLLTVKPAKKEGLAALFRNAAELRTLKIYPVYLILILILFSMLHDDIFFPSILLLVVTVVGYLLLRTKIIKWFSGITGDVLGASVEGVEVTLWMSLWLLHYFVMG